MKLTLLELVQDMLSAIDSEGVSDVGDTAEAGMCVSIANRSFEEMAVKYRWRHFRRLTQLSTTSSLNKLIAPSGSYAIDPESIYYDDTLVTYVRPEEFLSMTIKRNATDSAIDTIDSIKVYNDRNPQFFTSFDDENLVFDAIPHSVNGLSGSDSLALCYVAPTSRLTSNGQYFDMPAQAFPALNMLCLAKALKELKGDPQASALELREHKSAIARLKRTGRFIDLEDDVRKWIVPRRGLGMTYSPPRNSGNGFV